VPSSMRSISTPPNPPGSHVQIVRQRGNAEQGLTRAHEGRYTAYCSSYSRCLVGVAFLEVPGFGDDLTYWSFCLDLPNAHERLAGDSFHDLAGRSGASPAGLASLLGFGTPRLNG